LCALGVDDEARDDLFVGQNCENSFCGQGLRPLFLPTHTAHNLTLRAKAQQAAAFPRQETLCTARDLNDLATLQP
jgi:hypothetical protein